MKKVVQIALDIRLVVTVLLLAILVLFVALPAAKSDGQRKITVAGHARIKAQPDSYAYTAQYQAFGAREAVLDELHIKTTEVMNKLAELGVASSALEVQISAYDQSLEDTTKNGLSAHVTARTTQPNIAQAIKDYLVSTSPTSLSGPVVGFSETKQKNLQNEARDKAVADAKIQAERTARQLGMKLGKVLEIRDTVAGDLATSSESSESSADSTPHLVVEKEISFSVEAVFLMQN